MLKERPTPGPPDDPDLAAMVSLLRRRPVSTRAELGRQTGTGRNVVAALIRAGVAEGLVASAGTAPSTGGRAPQAWKFVNDAGSALAVAIEVEGFRLAVTDLSGNIWEQHWHQWPIQNGPEATLTQVCDTLSELISNPPAPIWGVGVSLPAPINHDNGRPVAPPIMPGWDGFDVRGFIAERVGLPVVVDNDVNAMALGHVYPGSPADAIYVEVGTGIGAGLLSHGQLHRGAQGAAGDIGHTRIPGHDDSICRCGRVGCLESVAGGWALERRAIRLALDGLSPYLADVRRRTGRIVLADIVSGVEASDTSCLALVATAARSIGGVLAVLVSFFNPETVIFAGPIPKGCPLFLRTIAEIVKDQALSLATTRISLRVAESGPDDALRGSALMLVDERFASTPSRTA